MVYAMDGGLWLHAMAGKVVRWRTSYRPIANGCSTTAEPPASRVATPVQTAEGSANGVRRDAWHWDLGGPVLPPRD